MTWMLDFTLGAAEGPIKVQLKLHARARSRLCECDVTRAFAVAAFQHFLLTRFSVKTRRGFPSERWVRRRMEIFEKVCLPSVAAQRDAEFTWIIAVGPSTPPDVLQRLRERQQVFPYVVLPITNGWLTPAKEHMRSALRAGVGHVITTRLDNDDALARSFMATVQEQFDGQDFEFVNLPRGLVKRLGDKRCAPLSHRSSPFLSLIERARGFKTVCVCQHGAAARHGSVRQVQAPAAWMMVVHGGNVSNRMYGRPRPMPELDSFALQD
jgi:hypothetical protein